MNDDEPALPAQSEFILSEAARRAAKSKDLGERAQAHSRGVPSRILRSLHSLTMSSATASDDVHALTPTANSTAR